MLWKSPRSGVWFPRRADVQKKLIQMRHNLSSISTDKSLLFETCITATWGVVNVPSVHEFSRSSHEFLSTEFLSTSSVHEFQGSTGCTRCIVCMPL
jgi:hypothetical protein